VFPSGPTGPEALGEAQRGERAGEGVWEPRGDKLCSEFQLPRIERRLRREPRRGIDSRRGNRRRDR